MLFFSQILRVKIKSSPIIKTIFKKILFYNHVSLSKILINSTSQPE